MSGANTPDTSPAPTMEHPVMTAAQGMFLVLNAASLRRLPMPFAAVAYDYSPFVDLQFRSRVDVVTWAAALDVAEPVAEVTLDGTHDHTLFETTWMEVPIRCISSIRRDPR